MDKIEIIDQVVFCKHGLKKEENVLGQKFLVTTIIYLKLGENGIKDDIETTINYSEVSKFVYKFMTENKVALIETVAQMLARELLVKYDKIKKVRVILKKPWAPIGLPLDTVLVHIKRKWNKAFISIGSNMGNRQEYLKNALKRINESKYCCVLEQSKIIETKAYGLEEQNDFLNQVIQIKTLFSPFELLSFLNSIEHSEGRIRELHWGPRTLDLDILFFGNSILNTEYLTIPHYDLQNREFVLKPICEINQYLIHPVLKKSMKELYEDLKSKSV